MKNTAFYWLAGSLTAMTLLWLVLFGGHLFAPALPAESARPPWEEPGASLDVPPAAPSSAPRGGHEALPRQEVHGGILVVMDDLGGNREVTRRLLALPIPVVFSVWPHAAHARETAEAAHSAGRDVFIHLPMQPRGYPAVDPGPGAVMLHTDAPALRRILQAAQERVPHAVGLNNHMGSRLTTDAASMERLCTELASCGLVILDSVTHPASVLYGTAKGRGLPALRRRLFLDHDGGGQALRQLEKAHALASAGEQVVVIGHPHPETLAALARWAAHRENAALTRTLRQMLEPHTR